MVTKILRDLQNVTFKDALLTFHDCETCPLLAAVPFKLEEDDEHQKASIWSCFNCGKLVTGQRKCSNFTCGQTANQKGQTDAEKLN